MARSHLVKIVGYFLMSSWFEWFRDASSSEGKEQ
jgi:hypothetical protein